MCFGITGSCSFHVQEAVSSSQPAFDNLQDKLHSVRVGRRYKEVLEKGREMCVFFATLAGSGPFSFGLELISISFAAARYFTGIPLSMDQLFFYFRGGLLQEPGTVLRNCPTHHTKSLKKFLTSNEASTDAQRRKARFTLTQHQVISCLEPCRCFGIIPKYPYIGIDK